MIGYARVSTTEQNTALQTDALLKAGARSIYEEHRSAVKRRPQLDQALHALRPGDTLLVYKVDRIARSMRDLLAILDRIAKRQAHFRSLTEPIDTTTPAGRMTLHLLGAFAEYERALIRERSIAGQEAARQRGSQIGRPRSLSPAQEKAAFRMVASCGNMAETARQFGVHLSCIKRVCLRITNPESPAVRKRQ